MKLNMDCVRDVLLKLEEETEFRSDFSFRPVCSEEFCYQFDSYPPHEVYHTLLMLEDAGYIYTINGNPKNTFQPHRLNALTVFDITFSGREFLNTVRDPKVWRYVKEKTSAVASVSLKIFVSVASAYIKAQMGF